MVSKRRHSLSGYRGFFAVPILTTVLICGAVAAQAAVHHVNPNRLGCPIPPTDPDGDTGVPGANGVMVYCTIEGAINHAGLDDTIYIAPGVYQESLTVVSTTNRSLTLIGSGISHTIIDSSTRAFLIKENLTLRHLSIDGVGPARSGMGGGIYIDGGASVTVSDVVVRNNLAGVGGGIAVWNGTLDMQRVAVINNTAEIRAANTNSTEPTSGGGIFIGADATLIAVDCVITGNQANIGIIPNNAGQTGGGFGAGIYNLGTTTLINTTISGNTANAMDKPGGGITNGNSMHSASLTLTNVTVTNNTATIAGGGVYNFNGTVNVRNSIIAGNADNGAAPDCGANSGNGFVSLDYNIIGASAGCDATIFPVAANDMKDVAAAQLNLSPLPATSSLFDDIPVFLFHALDNGSAAIDSIGINSCLDQNNNPLAGDQRGVARPFDGDNNGTASCDAGAYELAEDIIVYPAELITFEDQNTSSFYVTLAKPPAQSVQLNINSQMLTEGEIATPTISFDASDWNTPKAVEINVQNDGLEDGDQTYAVNVTDSVVTKTLSVTNIDTVIPPGLIVAPASINIAEGGPPAALRVRLSTPPTTGSVVNVIVDNDQPVGVDHQETISPSSLQFNDTDWRTFQEVSVSAVDDTIVEDSVSYHLVASVANDSTDPAFLGKTASIPITVDDNDQPVGIPGVTFTGTAGLTTSENGGQAMFTAVLDSAPSADVTINFVSNDANEGLLLAGPNQQQALPVTFTPLDWSEPQTITVVGVDDTYADGGRNFQIVMQIISDDTSYSSIQLTDIVVTNNDNDVADIILSSTAGLVTDESGTSTVFNVQLSAQPVPNTQVVLTATAQPPQSDLPLEGTLTLPPNQLIFDTNNYNQPQAITVTGLDDCAADGDKTYSIIVTVNTQSTTSPPYNSPNIQQSMSVTNTDNDSITSAQIVISKTQLLTSETQTSDSFDVCLTTQPTAPVTITMTIPANGETEGVFSNGSTTQEISIDPTNWSDLHTVSVVGLDDTVNDGEQMYQIDISPAVSLDPTYANMTVPANISVTNMDNDTASSLPGLAVDPLPEFFTTSESGKSATFSIQLTAEPSDDVSIKLTVPILENGYEGRIEDPVDSQLHEKTLLFTTTDWNIAQPVTIIGVDDTIMDNNILYDILLDTSGSTASEYQNISLPQIRIINEDNDRVKPNNPNSGGGAINSILLWSLCAFAWIRYRYSMLRPASVH